MTAAERILRDEIATQIAATFGQLAPYDMVAKFVRTGK